MFSVRIYGAGSIGNHLAHACRVRGWDVLVCDVDELALGRMKSEIYPSRYGRWDDAIRLAGVKDLSKNEKADLVIVGTPPDTHMKVALSVLEREKPKAILIEKPMCTPRLEGCDKLRKLADDKGVYVAVGYNHVLTANTRRAREILADGRLGDPITIAAQFREYWGGIFAAHPWLNGPKDSYLGFSERGGGATGEHSHAINIWQHFAHATGSGRIVEVAAMMDEVVEGGASYDRISQISVRTERGLIGSIVQDVVTSPPSKMLRMQCKRGFLEWHVNKEPGRDAVCYCVDGENPVCDVINKTRPDDFKGEIDELDAVMQGKSRGTDISLERGLETMMVVAASYISAHEKRAVTIDYGKGFVKDAIR